MDSGYGGLCASSYSSDKKHPPYTSTPLLKVTPFTLDFFPFFRSLPSAPERILKLQLAFYSLSLSFFCFSTPTPPPNFSLPLSTLQLKSQL